MISNVIIQHHNKSPAQFRISALVDVLAHVTVSIVPHLVSGQFQAIFQRLLDGLNFKIIRLTIWLLFGTLSSQINWYFPTSGYLTVCFFRDLPDLEHLDLSKNFIPGIASNTFNAPKLKRLFLANNRIRSGYIHLITHAAWVTPTHSYELEPTQSRALWYPKKDAFLKMLSQTFQNWKFWHWIITISDDFHKRLFQIKTIKQLNESLFLAIM